MTLTGSAGWLNIEAHTHIRIIFFENVNIRSEIAGAKTDVNQKKNLFALLLEKGWHRKIKMDKQHSGAS